MAITVVSKKQEYEYIPISERLSDKPVKFKFRPLTKEEKAKLEDRLIIMSPDQDIYIANASFLIGAIRLALLDVENLFDENGKEIKPTFENGQVSLSFIELLPDEIVQELGQVIVSVSKDPANADLYLGNFDKEVDEKPKRTKRAKS